MNEPTEKYGTSAENILCNVCDGEGCTVCNFTGRRNKKVEPEKEAEEYKKEREIKNVRQGKGKKT